MSAAGIGGFAQGLASGLQTGYSLGKAIKEGNEDKAVRDAMKEAANSKQVRGESRDIADAAVDYGITPEELAKAKKPEDLQKLFQGRQKLSNPKLNIAQDQPDLVDPAQLGGYAQAIPTDVVKDRNGNVVGPAAQNPRAAAIPTPNANPYPEVMDPDVSKFGNRADGTPKGTGWLGVHQRPDGGVSSEISAGFNINGKEVEVPLMVPGLDKSEMKYLMETPTDKVVDNLPDSIREKAVAFAKQRMDQGLSPFRQPGEVRGAGMKDVPAEKPKNPPHVYVDEFGRTRVAEDYTDLPRSQVLTRAADKLMAQGLADKADELYDKADRAQDRELKQDHKKFVSNLNSVRVALDKGDAEGANKYMQALVGNMNDTHDGFTYKFNKMPDGTLQLVGQHSSTGMPFPPQGGNPAGIIAQFNSTPGASAEFQMLNYLSGLENFDAFKGSVQTHLAVQDAVAKQAKADLERKKGEIELQFLPQEKRLGIAKDEESIAASKDRRALDHAEFAHRVKHDAAMEARAGDGSNTKWQDGFEPDVKDVAGNVIERGRRYYFDPKSRTTVYGPDDGLWGFPVGKKWVSDRAGFEHMARNAKARGAGLGTDDNGRPVYTDGKNIWYTKESWDKDHPSKR